MKQQRQETLERITSEYGTQLRMNRSIQTEGHFGDIKENDGFCRFNYKYHRFLHEEIKKFEGKTEKKAA